MVAADGQVYDVQCRYCGVVYQIIASRDDMESWMAGEGYIQDVLGYLSKGERELLISHTCDNCWKNMYGEDEDEV